MLHITAQFYVPPVISSAKPLNLHNLVTSLQNNSESFMSHRPGWNASQIQSLSVYWGVSPYGQFLVYQDSTRNCKEKTIINICNHNNNKCFQYSMLARTSKHMQFAWTINQMQVMERLTWTVSQMQLAWTISQTQLVLLRNGHVFVLSIVCNFLYVVLNTLTSSELLCRWQQYN